MWNMEYGTLNMAMSFSDLHPPCDRLSMSLNVGMIGAQPPIRQGSKRMIYPLVVDRHKGAGELSHSEQSLAPRIRVLACACV